MVQKVIKMSYAKNIATFWELRMVISDKKLIGQKIKNQRKKLKMTQLELAEKVGIHEKQLSRIEAGLHYPSLENFIKILNVLKLSLKEFDTEADEDIKEDLDEILKNSNEVELKIYHDVINSIKANTKYAFSVQ